MAAFLLSAGALLTLLVTLGCLQDVLQVQREPRLGLPVGPARGGPLISVLIPARNEEARIGACLEGLACQSYRHFEVIVVDDHSHDGTTQVVRSYADRMPLLKLIDSGTLPPEWAGKCWACWQAAGVAEGPWLLFLDADVVPDPGLLEALASSIVRHQVDVLSLMPLLRLGSLAERIVLPAFMSLLYGLYPLRRVNDPRSSLAFANGQCLLVRRAAYNALDGHRAVRSSILEDTHFGQLAKSAGWRLEVLGAPDLVSVRMYTNWSEVAEGLSKNAVAGFRSGGWRSAWIGFRQLAITCWPWYLIVAGAALLAPQASRMFGSILLLTGLVLAMMVAGVWAWTMQMRYRLPMRWGLLYPLGLAIYYGLAAIALLRLRFGQGVRWKGRTLSG